MLSNRKNSNHFESTSGDGLVHFLLLPMVVVPCYFIIFFFFFLSMKKKTIPLPISPWGISAFASFAIRVPITLFSTFLILLLDVEKTRNAQRGFSCNRRKKKIGSNKSRERKITIRKKIGSFYIYLEFCGGFLFHFRPGSVESHLQEDRPGEFIQVFFLFLSFSFTADLFLFIAQLSKIMRYPRAKVRSCSLMRISEMTPGYK